MSLQAESSALLDFKSSALLLHQCFAEFVEVPNWSSGTFLTWEILPPQQAGDQAVQQDLAASEGTGDSHPSCCVRRAEGWTRSLKISRSFRAVAWSTVRCSDASTSAQGKVLAAIYSFPDLLVWAFSHHLEQEKGWSILWCWLERGAIYEICRDF